MEFALGDIITMKKPHPCGCRDWEVLRVGADFRLRCVGCGHQVMLPRRLVEKNFRGFVKKHLHNPNVYGNIYICDILFISLLCTQVTGPETIRRYKKA